MFGRDYVIFFQGMSTFKGKIKEIPNISIDRFDHLNRDSEVYFLSHCHEDHMVGLADSAFQDHLINNNKFLYLSQISHHIIKQLYPNIEERLKILDPFCSNTIDVNGNCISVDIIPAGHCPGSVMFLFQNGKTILYTGDYRIQLRDLKNVKALYSMGRVKTIDKIYLDTTFFLGSYRKFPPRDESLEAICSVIKEWTSKSPKHIIKLHTSAKYGYEYLFREIFRKLEMPVHVTAEKYDFYRLFPELDKAVTKQGNKTQIHNSCGSNWRFICQYPTDEMKTIVISAFRWHGVLNGSFEEGGPNSHCVCYSTHSSYEEGLEFLDFLKPKAIEACVLHNIPERDQEIFSNIEKFLGYSVDENIKIFSLGSLLEEQVEETGEVKDFDILDSPPRKRKNFKS